MLTYNELKRSLKKDFSGLPALKVALLGDTATQLLATAIRAAGVELGIKIDLFEADFDQIEIQFQDLESELFLSNSDVVIVFQSTHKLLNRYSKADETERIALTESRVSFIQSICQSFQGKIIYYNYPEIDDMVLGAYANKVTSSFIFQLRLLNVELMKLAIENTNLYICDLASMQSKYGRNFMFQPSIYTNTDMVLSLDAIPMVAFRTVEIILALKGKFKKCLILDLDNTLWGGVIGDCGIENIQIGTLGIGKAFTELQLWAKKLRERGIILAICSKNTEAIAKEPFLKHPDMVLRLEDISVFVANWDNKADNIRMIQSILNIGFDSMVFVDDNPVERANVRAYLPEVLVPDLPNDPAEYLEFLYSLNLFETASYISSDTDRTKQYQVEAQRASLKKHFSNETDFLSSLNMISLVDTTSRFNIPRIAQLSQRSNQFNLRTIRYTEADIERLNSDDKNCVFSFSLSDKFGDNGLVCVVVLKEISSTDLFIENWFMSCRVLKRSMESYTLNEIMDYAKKKGYSRLIGEYIATAKNNIVADHYEKLDFDHLCETSYYLAVDTYQNRNCYIKSKSIE